MIASFSAPNSTVDRPNLPVIRQLTQRDREELRTHLLTLTAQDRRNRFSSSVTDDTINRYVDAIDWDPEAFLAIGAFIDGQLRGVAECCMFGAPDYRRGELSFSVQEAFQRRRLGTLLFSRILSFARNRDLREVSILTEASNHAMRAIAIRHGMKVTPDVELEGSLELHGPTPQSLSDEFECQSAGQGADARATAARYESLAV